MSTLAPKSRCDRCGKVTPDSQLLAYRGLCPNCAEQQHSESAQRLRLIERAEALNLTPGETHLLFSWEKDPADTLRWRRLPIRDPDLARRLACYKTIKRVLQFAGRIGDALPSPPHLTSCAEVIGAAGAHNCAQHLRALARAIHESSACTPLDRGAVVVGDGNRSEQLTARQTIRNHCDALRASAEDPLGLALVSFRRHPQSWRLVELVARRTAFPDHLRHVLGRHHARSKSWSANAVLRRLRPVTAPLADRALRRFDVSKPIHSTALVLQELLIPDADQSRQAEWDRLLLESEAQMAVIDAMAVHFEDCCPAAWIDAYRLYRNELNCEDLEERGGAELAAAVTAELRALPDPLL
jgi:hypothetical protein